MAVTFRDIKSDILAKITEGVWAPGAMVPNEIELSEQYGCARATVNRAMRELVEDGLIERRRKAGTRVRMTPVREARFSIPSLRAEIEGAGANYRYKLLEARKKPAPSWLGERFELPDGSPAMHVTCVHFADNRPYQYEDRWINFDVLPQVRDVDFSSVVPMEWLVATIPFSDVEISFSATSADQSLARHLQCAEGAPLFLTERATWWGGDAVTFVKLVFQSGHKMTTRY